MSWGKNFDVTNKTSIHTGISAGSALNKSLFIPIASGNLGIQAMINEDQLDEGLDIIIRILKKYQW